ncbi:MAG: hypothetical protein J6Y78_06655 [Paludibacteraceae bacterium]|nr:hypothetical protein [Paludibacteraceae bacterium]
MTMKNKFLVIIALLLISSTQSGKHLLANEGNSLSRNVEFGNYLSYKGVYPEAFIKYEYKGVIPVYSKPDGGVLIAKLRNKPDKELYYNVFLLKKNRNKYLTAIFDANDEDKFIAYGWVDRQYLGIFVKNFSQQLILFNKPDYNSDKLFTIYEYYPEVVQITDFSGLWLKVDFYMDKQHIFGWIPKEMQCANVFTTCC